MKRRSIAGRAIVRMAMPCLGVVATGWPLRAQAPRLQVLYVVPAGQTAKPQAEHAIGAIMTVLQRHYLQELGATFELAEPLVTRVSISQDAAYAVEWPNNVALIKARLGDDYLKRQNVVFSIIEGTSGAAGGSWNIVKMTGGFWNTAYDTYRNQPYLLTRELHGWSHELGHAFGLLHTEDARKCFASHQVDLGTLPSLIMQKGTDLGTVYNYPFLAQEKRLLTDTTYFRDCLPLLSETGQPARPHPSRHLTRRSVQPTLAHGLNANRVEFGPSGGPVAGAFAQVGARRWVEQDAAGTTRFTFDEVHRDEWTVYLRDAGRGVDLGLDLYRRMVRFRSAAAPQWRDLYPVLRASADPNGRSLTQAAYSSGERGAPQGLFVAMGDGTWAEQVLPDKRTTYRFREAGRDDWSVLLQDPTRNVTIILDAYRNRVMFKGPTDPSPRPLYAITWVK